MVVRLFAAAAVGIVISACSKNPQPRRYSEIAFHANGMPGMPATAQAPIRITWKLPDGWVEEPADDPMRVASFLAPDSAVANTGEIDPQAADVSITQFAGDAGGIEANLSRWMRQAKLPASPDQVKKVKSRGQPVHLFTGQTGTLFDFTSLLSGDITQNSSILGAIIPGPGYTVFVKATGDHDRLVRLKPVLQAFCDSLSITEDAK